MKYVILSYTTASGVLKTVIKNRLEYTQFVSLILKKDACIQQESDTNSEEEAKTIKISQHKRLSQIGRN